MTRRGHVDQLKVTDGESVFFRSTSSDGATPYSSSPVDKRMKNQEDIELRPIFTESPSDDDIFLPPCTLHRGLFAGKKNLLLHLDEAKHIISRDKVIQGRELLEDIESMMRVEALVMALNAQKICP